MVTILKEDDDNNNNNNNKNNKTNDKHNWLSSPLLERFRDSEAIIQMEHNKFFKKLRIPAGRRRTKWLFTSMEEDLNSGLQRTYSYFEKGCRKKCARDNPER